jgi:hypothetical protein
MIKSAANPDYGNYHDEREKWFKQHKITINETVFKFNGGKALNITGLVNAISTSVKEVLELGHTFNIGETKSVVIGFWAPIGGHAVTCFCSKLYRDEYKFYIADSNDSNNGLRPLTTWGNFLRRTIPGPYFPLVQTTYSDTVFNTSFSYHYDFLKFNEVIFSEFTDKNTKMTSDILDHLRDETWFFQNMLFLNREFAESIYPRFKNNSMDITLGKRLNGMVEQKTLSGLKGMAEQKSLSGFCDLSAIKVEVQLLKSYIPQLEDSDVVFNNYTAARCAYANTLIGFVATAFDSFVFNREYQYTSLRKRLLLGQRSASSALTAWDCRRDDLTCNPAMDKLIPNDILKEQRQKNEEYKREQERQRQRLMQKLLLIASTFVGGLMAKGLMANKLQSPETKLQSPETKDIRLIENKLESPETKDIRIKEQLVEFTDNEELIRYFENNPLVYLWPEDPNLLRIINDKPYRFLKRSSPVRITFQGTNEVNCFVSKGRLTSVINGSSIIFETAEERLKRISREEESETTTS